MMPLLSISAHLSLSHSFFAHIFFLNFFVYSMPYLENVAYFSSCLEFYAYPFHFFFVWFSFGWPLLLMLVKFLIMCPTLNFQSYYFLVSAFNAVHILFLQIWIIQEYCSLSGLLDILNFYIFILRLDVIGWCSFPQSALLYVLQYRIAFLNLLLIII